MFGQKINRMKTIITLITLVMVTISSFNGNGLRSKDRREQALMICDSDIICLQETHWDERCVEDVRKEWMGEMYVNNGSVGARGVAILIKTGVVTNIRKGEDDGVGRMVGIMF